MYLASNRYTVLSALIMHEINLTYISIPHIYKCFVSHGFFFTVQPLRAPGYCRRPSGWAGGRADKPRYHSHVHNFSRIIFELGKDINYPEISKDFNHGGSASLNMRIMDHLMSRPLLAFLDSFFKLKSPNLVQR